MTNDADIIFPIGPSWCFYLRRGKENPLFLPNLFRDISRINRENRAAEQAVLDRPVYFQAHSVPTFSPFTFLCLYGCKQANWFNQIHINLDYYSLLIRLKFENSSTPKFL